LARVHEALLQCGLTDPAGGQTAYSRR
jgi:hypothetical protein